MTEKQQGSPDDGQKITFISMLSKVSFSKFGQNPYEKFGQVTRGGGSIRLVLLCLGLLNAALVIAAIAIGVNCAKVAKGSIHRSHSAAAELINKLDDLTSKHSDVLEAEEEAKNAFDNVLKNHTELKLEIEKKKEINDNFQRQLDVLQEERKNLQANVSALEESCSKCPPKWFYYNSSCYYFSNAESSISLKDWPGSRQDCLSRGADLIVIDRPEEQTFVSEYIGKPTWGVKETFWIGLTDIKTEGEWVWVNNVTEVEQRYWADGEPNDIGGEDCAATFYDEDNPWMTRNDVPCKRYKANWICEITLS